MSRFRFNKLRSLFPADIGGIAAPINKAAALRRVDGTWKLTLKTYPLLLLLHLRIRDRDRR